MREVFPFHFMCRKTSGRPALFSHLCLEGVSHSMGLLLLGSRGSPVIAIQIIESNHAIGSSLCTRLVVTPWVKCLVAPPCILLVLVPLTPEEYSILQAFFLGVNSALSDFLRVFNLPSQCSGLLEPLLVVSAAQALSLPHLGLMVIEITVILQILLQHLPYLNSNTKRRTFTNEVQNSAQVPPPK